MLNFFASVTAEAEFKAEAAERGLGPIPLHVRSAANILLFNSTENPYKQYNELDNLLQGQERERQQESSAAGLAAAPKTLIDGDDQVRCADARTHLCQDCSLSAPVKRWNSHDHKHHTNERASLRSFPLEAFVII